MDLFPVDDILPQLKQAVARNSSAVLHAPPGAGKTTRVPLALLDVIPPEQGRIVMLEPRRIAAVSAARWMAGTLGEKVGETVGYRIRFDSRVAKSTRIEVVTEGILTRRIRSDQGLDGVAMVIFDEFHERSLHADLALALCLDIREALREDLRILVMSATLDCGPVASLLGDAPVITAGGKSFPVEERYLVGGRDKRLPERVVDAVRTAVKNTEGDILVFLPGSEEIRSCAERLRPLQDGADGGISIHLLYGDLPFREQERAILPSNKRKIVLATNIAETSLTIEGVKIVIDSGLTRRLLYDASTGMNRLVTVSVSQASAAQRKGRAGRLGAGICYRLYSRQAYQGMIPFAPPEILISDLSSTALELSLWGVKDPSVLSWLDPPPAAAWESARRLLTDLGALDDESSVTPAGRSMARLPLHPRLARLMLKAAGLRCLHPGADLAALLSERDVMKRDGLVRLQGGEPDITERIEMLQRVRNGKEIKGADPWALRAVEKTSSQLLRLMPDRPGDACQQNADDDTVARLLISGFPDRLAKRRDEGGGRFLLANGRGVRLSPSSSLTGSAFIVAPALDAGDKAEGTVHIAAPVSEEVVRGECAGQIRTVRRVEWDKSRKRIVSAAEERIGAILLSARPFNASDDECLPLLCEAVRSDYRMLCFSRAAREFQARVAFMHRVFGEEEWPDISDECLASSPEEWLLPWLTGIRSEQELSSLDLLPALRAQLSWDMLRLLDERSPVSITVPSGHRVRLDYTGDTPVLAVKLQEMFGLAETPEIGGGRVKVLLHLLSPARRPVQITRDLKGFWNGGYQEVKKELKGRYPKHPWPDDPWNAVPTGKTKGKGG
ncbi:MAG: ATP-dependent helicase HrpB [Candidatus Sulfobium sp.]